MANNERKSLVVQGARPRLDVIYEVLLVLVATGGAWWIIAGIGNAPPLSKGLSEGANALIKGLICVVVVVVAAYLLTQTFVLNGHFGVVYGLVRGGSVYLASPEGVAGSRTKRLLCDGPVTMAVRTDAESRGAASTPSTRFRFECGGSTLQVQAGVPVGEPGEAQAAIRAWLEAHGVSVEEVEYPKRSAAPQD